MPTASRPSSTRIVDFGNEPAAKTATPRLPDDADHRHRAQRVPQVQREGPDPGRRSSIPRSTRVGDGRVTGRAIVDLDAVRTQKQRGWLDPMALPDGTASRSPRRGTLTTQNGVGQFTLESAEISGVTIPKIAAAGAPQLLLAHARESRPASTWTIPSSCPRASARSASARRRPRSFSSVLDAQH